VRTQEEPHRKKSFQEQFVEFLKRHEIPFDEQHQWHLGLTPPGYNMPPLCGWEKGIRTNRESAHEPGADAAGLQHAAAARLGERGFEKTGRHLRNLGADAARP